MSAEPPPPGLEGFQAEITEVALRAIGLHGFALAGAGALVAHGVISRPTQDLDLFGPAEGGPGQVSESLLAALIGAGCRVQVLEPVTPCGNRRQTASRRTGASPDQGWLRCPTVSAAAG